MVMNTFSLPASGHWGGRHQLVALGSQRQADSLDMPLYEVIQTEDGERLEPLTPPGFPAITKWAHIKDLEGPTIISLVEAKKRWGRIPS